MITADHRRVIQSVVVVVVVLSKLLCKTFTPDMNLKGMTKKKKGSTKYIQNQVSNLVFYALSTITAISGQVQN